MIHLFSLPILKECSDRIMNRLTVILSHDSCIVPFIAYA